MFFFGCSIFLLYSKAVNRNRDDSPTHIQALCHGDCLWISIGNAIDTPFMSEAAYNEQDSCQSNEAVKDKFQLFRVFNLYMRKTYSFCFFAYIICLYNSVNFEKNAQGNKVRNKTYTTNEKYHWLQRSFFITDF